MSDFKDIVKSAMDKGILLDSCGLDERQYWWGLYNDLCGMSVEDALKVQYYHQEGDIDPKKKTNIVNFVMQKGGSGNYTLYLVPTYAPTSPVIVSFVMDGATQTVTLPAGVTSYNTELTGTEPTKPYAEISNVALTSQDEQYNYAGKNSVQTGIFTITIDNAGDVTVDNVKYGETVTLPSAPEKEGYTFSWKDSDGQVITGDTIVMPEKDITITGTYKINQYVISYTVSEEYLDANEDIQTRVYKQSSVTVNYGVKVLNYLKSSSVAREGYSVSAWETSDGAEITDAFTMPASNLSASCEYTLNEYSVKYYVDGSLYSEAEYYFGATTVVPENPSKIGYNFDGWTVEVPAAMPARNIETSANFVAIDYHIYYIIDGETAYTEVHHYGDAISIRADEVREGYTFEWNPSSLPATMPTEDIVVNGAFTAIDYAFKCVVDGVEVVERTYHFEDTIGAVESPEKVGYTFTGWNPVIPATMPSHDLTCVAEFEINSHTITYSVDGVIVTAYTETHNYGEAISIRADEDKEGYTFSGWNPSSLPATMPDEDIAVSGTFAINSYDIEYFVDGSAYSSETYEYSAAIVPVEEPEREGYTFSGWDEVPATMPAHDVEVNGTFAINSYEIAYVVDGEPYSAETYEFGAAITPVAEPSKVGYTFGGWSEIPATMPAHDVEVEGEFTVNSHTINYIVDGEPFSAETYNYGEAIVPIAAPAKTGYTFTEWSGITATMPDNDLTVSAVYEINSHVAEYQIKSGATYEHFTSVTYNYGETIVDPVAPERTGYTFAWEAHVATMPDNDIIVRGEYTEIVKSTMIYYNTILNDELTGLTADVISGFTDNFDGDGVTKQEADGIIPMSQECANYKALAEEAYDEGDETTGDHYYALYEEYMETHPFTYVFVIPETLNFSRLSDGMDNTLAPSVLKTVEFDDTVFTVYTYTSPGYMYQTDIDQTIPLFITLN